MILAVNTRYPELSGYDMLVPVPAYARPKGYDHAEELAKAIAELLCKPWNQPLLKVRDEKLVDKGSDDERWEAAKDLYAPSAKINESSGKGIILIDDICTSGSTLSHCSRIVSQQGKASRVCALVAARRFDTGCPVA
jgi:predicted amidophosphoribosyltransferase